MIFNKKIVSICSLAALLALGSAVRAAPTEEDIRQDIAEFQQFFQSRFPDVALSSYQDGIYALPQSAQRRRGWELLMEYPPFESQMNDANTAWKAPMPNGLSLADCFAGKPPANAYPYFFANKVHTIVGDINQCRTDNGAEMLDGNSNELAQLVAAFKAPWSGQQMDVDYRSEEMRELYAKGKQYFWAKRGQMNLSCANCHVHNAGNQLRGDILSAALGQTTGYPAYSTSWSLGGSPMGTTHRRYGLCNALAGAAPLPSQSEEYIALEVYQAIMNSGIPLKVPSQRQ